MLSEIHTSELLCVIVTSFDNIVRSLLTVKLWFRNLQLEAKWPPTMKTTSTRKLKCSSTQPSRPNLDTRDPRQTMCVPPRATFSPKLAIPSDLIASPLSSKMLTFRQSMLWSTQTTTTRLSSAWSHKFSKSTVRMPPKSMESLAPKNISKMVKRISMEDQSATVTFSLRTTGQTLWTGTDQFLQHSTRPARILVAS